MQIVAKTFHGLEDVLVQELEALGAQNINKVTRAVEFEGDKKLLYRANYELRTALRILVPFHKFRARHENHFYKKVSEFDWSTLISNHHTFAISAAVKSKYFTHSKYMSLKMKDAIVDQFRRKTGDRPSIDTQTPDWRFHLLIQEDRCEIALDSSGDSLHKRGYRQNTLEAPINEALAAGMILLSGWKNETTLFDPMCGAGTIPIEAAMIARNIPPQILKERFGFHGWKDFDRSIWQEVVEEAKNRMNQDDLKIKASDIDPQARFFSRKNAMLVDLDEDLTFERKDFYTIEPEHDEGMVIMNPPYHERLELDDAEQFYQEIGDHFKNKFQGWTAWMISSNKDALKRFGLRPSKKITLYNGKLECRYQKFELFKGKRNDFLKQKE